MLGPVVQQMAALAERPEIAVARAAMRRVVVEMRRRQHDLSHPCRRIRGWGGRGDPASFAVAPDLALLIPPAAVAEMLDGPAMRSAACLAMPPGADEPDPVTDLRPVDRIEKSQLRSYRHRSILSRPASHLGRSSCRSLTRFIAVGKRLRTIGPHSRPVATAPPAHRRSSPRSPGAAVPDTIRRTGRADPQPCRAAGSPAGALGARSPRGDWPLAP